MIPIPILMLLMTNGEPRGDAVFSLRFPLPFVCV